MQPSGRRAAQGHYATDSGQVDADFLIETLGEAYAAPLRRTLEKAGITLDVDHLPAASPQR